MKKNNYKKYTYLLFLIIIAGTFTFTACGKQEYNNIPQEVPEPQQEQKEINVPVQNPTENIEGLPAFGEYNYQYTYTLDIQGYVKDLNLAILLPVDEYEKQYISDMKISIEPSRIYNDGVNTIAEYTFEGLNTQKINIVFEGSAKVRTYNITTAEKMNKKLTQEQNLDRYLQPENLIESDDIFIKNTANKIKGETRQEIVQNIYEYIQKNLSYKVLNGNLGAKKALEQKYGKCSEYSAVMVALCRAKNIPARLVVGNIARDEITQHNWVEVWYDDYGWVAYDPTAQATIVNIYDQNGKLVKQEKRYNTSHDNLKYIASGRNKFGACNIRYSVSDRKNGRVSLSEQILIQKK